MRSLCIDFGSTFVKFFVYDSKQIIYEGKLPFPSACREEGKIYEVATADIDDLVFDIMKQTESYWVDRCYIAVQMHGYVLQYGDGRFSNYVSWKDQRADITAPLLQKIDFERNGTALKANLAAAKLLCKKEQPECMFFTLGSYIAYLLTGKNITHKTDACASGFFDAQTLEPITVPQFLHLPQVYHKVMPVGMYRNIRIYTPVGDHQASFLGSGAGTDAYLLNIGTATQLSTLAKQYESGTDFEKRPYFDQYRLLTVSGLTGGEKLYGGYDTSAFLEEILEAVRKLPWKKKMMVGGGGADLVFDQLETYFLAHGIQCVKLEHSISTEGMKMLSDRKKTKNGTMLSEVYFANFPVILKNAKLDFFIIDNEHGAFDYGFLSAIVMNARLVDLPVIVRLPDNQRRDITKLVDMGVTGFLLPMTNTAEDIRQVVEYAKYAPVGKRGISTNRAHTFYDPPAIGEYMASANEKVKVYAQIETREGVENLDAILSVEGVDGLFVGPNDLSCDMGCIGNNEPVKEVLQKVAAATRKHCKEWGIITTSSELIRASLENQVDCISYGSEINMLKDASKKIRRTIQESGL